MKSDTSGGDAESVEGGLSVRVEPCLEAEAVEAVTSVEAVEATEDEARYF